MSTLDLKVKDLCLEDVYGAHIYLELIKTSSDGRDTCLKRAKLKFSNFKVASNFF